MSQSRESANRRRNIRQQKPADDAAKPAAARKDTKRWCGGKVGREHELVCYVEDRWWFVGPEMRPRTLACKNCGKEADRWHAPRAWETKPRPKPPWVDK